MAMHTASGTATNTANLWTLLRTFVETTCGWTVHDDQSGAGTPYMIWSTIGEGGTDKCFIRMEDNASYVNTLQLYTYRFWDAAAHTGNDVSPAYPASTVQIKTVDASSFLYWFFGDLDAIHVVTKISTTYYLGFFGIMDSIWSHDYAITANSETAGSDVVVEVDDTAIFTVDQYYGMINKNNATGSYEKVRCKAIDPGVSITLYTMANNHPAGAILGEDPYPNAVGLDIAAFSLYTIRYDGGLITTHTVSSWTGLLNYADPDVRQGLIWIMPIGYLSTAGPDLRGFVRHAYGTGDSTLANEDTITVGSEVYKFFTLASTMRVAIRQA